MQVPIPEGGPPPLEMAPQMGGGPRGVVRGPLRVRRSQHGGIVILCLLGDLVAEAIFILKPSMLLLITATCRNVVTPVVFRKSQNWLYARMHAAMCLQVATQKNESLYVEGPREITNCSWNPVLVSRLLCKSHIKLPSM